MPAEPAVDGRLLSSPRVFDRLLLKSPPKGDLLDFFRVAGIDGLVVTADVDGGAVVFRLSVPGNGSAETGS